MTMPSFEQPPSDASDREQQEARPTFYRYSAEDIQNIDAGNFQPVLEKMERLARELIVEDLKAGGKSRREQETMERMREEEVGGPFKMPYPTDPWKLFLTSEIPHRTAQEHEQNEKNWDEFKDQLYDLRLRMERETNPELDSSLRKGGWDKTIRKAAGGEL